MFLSKCKTVSNNIQKKLAYCCRMEELKTTLHNCRARPGLLYAAASCFFFATSSVLVHIVDEIQAIQAVFYRSLVQLIFTIPMLIYHGLNPLPDRENLHVTFFLILRGAAGSTALCFQFYAFQHMPLSDATVIIFSSPIFTGILAYFFLGETWSKLDAISTMLCFLGVLLIAHPSSFFLSSFENRQHVMYSLVAFTGAILTSVSIVVLKKLRGVHYVLSSFYLSLVGTIGTGFVCLYPGVLRQVICGHQFLIVFIGLCAVGGQCLLCKSLCTEKVSTVALVRTFDIVLAFIFQLIFFNHKPNVYSVSGAIMVSFCNALVILNASKSTTEEEKNKKEQEE